MKRWDRRALEGLPLKLLMISLLLSLSAPVVLGSIDGYERSIARSRLEAEAGLIADTIEEVCSAGEGNRRTLSISISPDWAKFSLVLEIGGNIDSASSMSVRCLSQERTFSTYFMEDPPARATSSSGGIVRLEAGVYDLSFDCVSKNGRLVIIVEVMD